MAGRWPTPSNIAPSTTINDNDHISGQSDRQAELKRVKVDAGEAALRIRGSPLTISDNLRYERRGPGSETRTASVLV
jgi:hypothetical protein